MNMPPMKFDTLRIAQQLTTAGVCPKQAEAHTKVLTKTFKLALNENSIMRDDINVLKQDTNTLKQDVCILKKM